MKKRVVLMQTTRQKRLEQIEKLSAEVFNLLTHGDEPLLDNEIETFIGLLNNKLIFFYKICNFDDDEI